MIFFFGLLILTAGLFVLSHNRKQVMALLILAWIFSFSAISFFVLGPLLACAILCYGYWHEKKLPTPSPFVWTLCLLCLILLTHYLESSHLEKTENALLMLGWYLGGSLLGIRTARAYWSGGESGGRSAECLKIGGASKTANVESNTEVLSFLPLWETSATEPAQKIGFSWRRKVFVVSSLAGTISLLFFLTVSFAIFQIDFWSARMLLTDAGPVGWLLARKLNMDFLFFLSGLGAFMLGLGFDFLGRLFTIRRLASHEAIQQEQEGHERRKSPPHEKEKEEENENSRERSRQGECLVWQMENHALFFMFLITGYVLQNIYVTLVSSLALGFFLAQSHGFGSKKISERNSRRNSRRK